MVRLQEDGGGDEVAASNRNLFKRKCMRDVVLLFAGFSLDSEQGF